MKKEIKVKKIKWGLHISTAVSQWDRTEGSGMMDDGEMRGQRGKNNNLGTSGRFNTDMVSYTV